MNKELAQQGFKEEYSKMGTRKPQPFVNSVPENKHGVDNPVQDLNVDKLSGIEKIADHTYLGNTSGSDGPPTSQDLGINTHFISKDNIGITVVNGLVTLATSTSTSSSTSSSSSSSSSTHSTSSSSVSTSSSSSSSSSTSSSSSSSS